MSPYLPAGLRVVVTRAEHQSEGLAAAFELAGAQVERLPLLEIVPPADPRPLERAASELALYEWIVFTSSNAVEAFLPRTGGALPSRLKVAVVGPATAEALRDIRASSPTSRRLAPTPKGCWPSWLPGSAASGGSSSPRPPTPAPPCQKA